MALCGVDRLAVDLRNPPAIDLRKRDVNALGQILESITVGQNEEAEHDRVRRNVGAADRNVEIGGCVLDIVLENVSGNRVTIGVGEVVAKRILEASVFHQVADHDAHVGTRRDREHKVLRVHVILFETLALLKLHLQRNRNVVADGYAELAFKRDGVAVEIDRLDNPAEVDLRNVEVAWGSVRIVIVDQIGILVSRLGIARLRCIPTRETNGIGIERWIVIHLVEQLEGHVAIGLDRELEDQTVAIFGIEAHCTRRTADIDETNQLVAVEIEADCPALGGQAEIFQIVARIVLVDEHEGGATFIILIRADLYQTGKARRDDRLSLGPGFRAVRTAVVRALAHGAFDAILIVVVIGIEIVEVVLIHEEHDRLGVREHGHVVLHVDRDDVHDHVAIRISGDEGELQPDEIFDRRAHIADARIGMVDLVIEREPDLAVVQIGKFCFEYKAVARFSTGIENAIAVPVFAIVSIERCKLRAALAKELAIDKADELGAVIDELIHDDLTFGGQERAVVQLTLLPIEIRIEDDRTVADLVQELGFIALVGGVEFKVDLGAGESIRLGRGQTDRAI